ncbi:Hypp9110 [Branchiostoma lanceolatum]|uniref:Hypp9110 protein n=1 Tax=Branchiostoma lanceolatum TaxID=7740 RepID=A0A8J9ZE09_BRALA|nr:Hypp9110 [Branchiostoma lanceolatum]
MTQKRLGLDKYLKDNIHFLRKHRKFEHLFANILPWTSCPQQDLGYNVQSHCAHSRFVPHRKRTTLTTQHEPFFLKTVRSFFPRPTRVFAVFALLAVVSARPERNDMNGGTGGMTGGMTYDGCIHNGNSYNVGDTFEEGCYLCECRGEGTGFVSCTSKPYVLIYLLKSC